MKAQKDCISFVIARLLVAMIAVSGFLATPANAAKKALVIGIGDYPHVSKLNGPKQDANNMRELLITDLGYDEDQVKMLLDEQASRNEIKKAIDSWLVKGTASGDEVFFYFSGHGTQKKDENGDEGDGKDEALVAYDTKLVDRKITNLISDDEMELAFSKLDGRSVTIIIDSCHSGTLTRGVFGLGNPKYEKSISFSGETLVTPTKDIVQAHRAEVSFLDDTENRVVWSAVSAWQKALIDFETKNGSVFTNYFIAGLRDKAADLDKSGNVTRAELISYIRKESDNFCQRNKKFCKTGLTPTLETSKDLYIEEAVSFSSNSDQFSTIQPAAYIDQSLVSSNTSKIKMDVSPRKQQYFVDEAAKISIEANQDGYLLVLDVSQSGQLTQLYPQSKEEIHTRGKIANGSTINFDTQATLPTGQGMLVAILSKDDVLPSSALESTTKDLIVEAPENYIQEVTQALNATWTNDSQFNRAVDWSVEKFKYDIVQK